MRKRPVTPGHQSNVDHDERRVCFHAPLSARAVAEAYGIDMSLLDENLRKTPEERIQQQSDAQNAIFELRKAMEERKSLPEES